MIFDNEPFVFIDPPKSLPGAGFILSTEPPFYIGKVIKMKPEEVQEFAVKEKRKFALCKGYSVAILGENSLSDESAPDGRYYPNYYDYGNGNLKQMADFYLNYRIIPNAGRYKRYKL